ncbi:MAG: methyltransferase domain-containing protein [FCB group bacterium]|nr:methyltransferase domain-containing protein [FCB group bacterium]
MDGTIKPNWADDCWKDMLVFQRKSMWLEGTVKRLAAWLDLKQGMTAVDVGCGLGYLGYTFWPFFGQGGHYIGVDNTPELVKEAEKDAAGWADGGRAKFVEGDAYKLPLPDNYADLVMCQTLLIHLDDPEKAVAEMIRVAKPGGLILCNEPDNHNPGLGRMYNSVSELSIDDHLFCARVHMICHQGRIKLGLGDGSIGPKVPHMLKAQGLIDIDVRNNDRVHYLEPPYDGPLQQSALEHVRRSWLDPARRKVLMAQQKEFFLAGGGEPDDYECYLEIIDPYMEIMREQVESGEYFSCAPTSFFTIKARKPGG